MTEINVVKICIAGMSGSGKTMLARKIAGEDGDVYLHNTIGIDFFHRYYPHRKIKIHIWDLGGGERFQTITREYYKHANLLVAVYICDSPASVRTVSSIIADYREKQPDGVILLVGNVFHGYKDVYTEELACEVSRIYRASRRIVDILSDKFLDSVIIDDFLDISYPKVLPAPEVKMNWLERIRAFIAKIFHKLQK